MTLGSQTLQKGLHLKFRTPFLAVLKILQRFYMRASLFISMLVDVGSPSNKDVATSSLHRGLLVSELPSVVVCLHVCTCEYKPSCAPRKLSNPLSESSCACTPLYYNTGPEHRL